jgi:hypothetical protein
MKKLLNNLGAFIFGTIAMPLCAILGIYVTFM